MIISMKALNEEYYVDRCISDFHDEPFVDKIIVIDGGSTDYTVQELKKYSKVEVYIHPWLDWYHDMEVIQSNITLSYVPHGELLFILDFDERMSIELKQALNNINLVGFSTDTGHVSRITNELIRYENSPFAIMGESGWPLISHQIGQYPDYQCRLLKKDYRMRWVNSPHHVLIGWEGMINININADIIHYEKDDYRDRLRIERKWLRSQVRRKELGLPADVFECRVNLEVAEYASKENWYSE